MNFRGKDIRANSFFGFLSKQQMDVAEVTLTSAQIKALLGTPITIVAAPGEGKAIIPIHLAWSFRYVAPVYNLNGGGLSFHYEDDTTPLASNNIHETPADNLIVDDFGGGAFAIDTELAVNKALELSSVTANATAGNGTLKVSLLYRILTV